MQGTKLSKNPIRTVLMLEGIVFGLGSIAHGVFEILQGNTPVPGLVIQAIGPEQRLWVHGTEEAFTIFPTFLLTGILATTFGIAAIIWSIGFLNRRHGATVFLMIFIASFLSGGGIGQLVFFIPAWAFGTRMHSSLPWWNRVMGSGTRQVLAHIWPYSLSLAVTGMLYALFVSNTGIIPGIQNPDTVLNITLIIVLVCALLFPLSFVSAIAHRLVKSKTMLVWTCLHYGPPEVLIQNEMLKPEPRDHEILIKVESRPVTVADCRIRGFRVPPSYRLAARVVLGFTKPRKSILGNYFAGVVTAVGNKTTRFKLGDRIFGSTGRAFGTYAEFVSVRESNPIQLIPDELTFDEAAASPWGAGTALFFLQQTKLKSGMHILINGASGSIGLAAIQLAKYYGLKVTAVCSAKNRDIVLSVGADDVIDYNKHDFTAENNLYEMVLDTVGNHPVKDLCNPLIPGGTLLHVIATPAIKREARRYTPKKQILFIGGDTVVHQKLLDFITERLKKKELRPMIDGLFTFDQMVEAHRRVDSGRKTGDVIVQSLKSVTKKNDS